MEKVGMILLAGIILLVTWLCACTLLEGRKRKNVIIIGIIIDVILFIICRNFEFLMISIVGGILGGLGFGSFIPKYTDAVREMKGVKNYVVVCMIAFVMIFMTIAIAFPEVKIDYGFELLSF